MSDIKPKFIFITGGVVSSLGKGIAAAAIGALLQARGFSVCLRKLDPYLNIDPGTMSPQQHGEVYVTEDGTEADLDLGHYERFTGVPAKRGDSTSAGKIYFNLLSKERRGDYLGSTVQVIPHVTDLIKNFILANTHGIDFVLCEIGGTVGDIEGLPFFESIRQLGNELGRSRTAYVHLTLLPYIATAKELKTKPTQHSVKELRSIGIQPDILLCRSEREISASDKQKIALFCNIQEKCVIPALDQANIYNVPIAYHKNGLDSRLLELFDITQSESLKIQHWIDIVENMKQPLKSVKIAIVGKYQTVRDSYKSLIEALTHGGIANHCEVNLVWIDAAGVTDCNVRDVLSNVDGILVPGGFGYRGSEGKISAIKYAIDANIPYFGICFGMQLAVIAICRKLLGIEDATSGEFFDEGIKGTAVIEIMEKWSSAYGVETRTKGGELGGSMRLGLYNCLIAPKTLVHSIYNELEISERHRHRYEVDIAYKAALESCGTRFSGMSTDGVLTEIIELEGHRWFIGVQFHPEFKSRPFAPHPLFASFISAAITYNQEQQVL